MDAQVEINHASRWVRGMYGWVLPVVLAVVLGLLALPGVPVWTPPTDGVVARSGYAVALAALAVSIVLISRTVLQAWLVRLLSNRAQAVVLGQVDPTPRAAVDRRRPTRQHDRSGGHYLVRFKDHYERLWQVPVRVSAFRGRLSPGDQVTVTYQRTFPPHATSRTPGGLPETALVLALTVLLAFLSAIALRAGDGLIAPG